MTVVSRRARAMNRELIRTACRGSSHGISDAPPAGSKLGHVGPAASQAPRHEIFPKSGNRLPVLPRHGLCTTASPGHRTARDLHIRDRVVRPHGSISLA